MLGITDLGDGVSQGILPARLEYNMEVDSGASGWVAQILPVYWNGTLGVLDLHVVPRYDGRREVGEGHCGEEEEHKGPEVLHKCRTSPRKCEDWKARDPERQRNAENTAGMQRFYGGFHGENRGWVGAKRGSRENIGASRGSRQNAEVYSRPSREDQVWYGNLRFDTPGRGASEPP